MNISFCLAASDTFTHSKPDSQTKISFITFAGVEGDYLILTQRNKPDFLISHVNFVGNRRSNYKCLFLLETSTIFSKCLFDHNEHIKFSNGDDFDAKDSMFCSNGFEVKALVQACTRIEHHVQFATGMCIWTPSIKEGILSLAKKARPVAASLVILSLLL